MSTVAYVVFRERKVVALFRELEDAEWLAFMLGSGAKVKRLTSETLLRVLQKLGTKP